MPTTAFLRLTAAKYKRRTYSACVLQIKIKVSIVPSITPITTN